MFTGQVKLLQNRESWSYELFQKSGKFDKKTESRKHSKIMKGLYDNCDVIFNQSTNSDDLKISNSYELHSKPLTFSIEDTCWEKTKDVIGTVTQSASTAISGVSTLVLAKLGQTLNKVQNGALTAAANVTYYMWWVGAVTQLVSSLLSIEQVISLYRKRQYKPLIIEIVKVMAGALNLVGTYKSIDAGSDSDTAEKSFQESAISLGIGTTAFLIISVLEKYGCTGVDEEKVINELLSTKEKPPQEMELLGR